MKNDEPMFGVAGEADQFRIADLNEPAFGRGRFAWHNVQDSA